jgi:hypothetical protein
VPTLAAVRFDVSTRGSHRFLIDRVPAMVP